MAVVERAAPHLVGTSGDSLREAFGKALVEWSRERPQVVVLDADIAGGTGAHHFRSAQPHRFFQFGIAEQNMMAAAGGMAATGLIPVVTTFAVFCLRAIEQARLSIAYARRNVKIVASHPGIDVGPDGGSAQALEDLAAFRAIPGMTVISPADPEEMRQATRAILDFVNQQDAISAVIRCKENVKNSRDSVAKYVDRNQGVQANIRVDQSLCTEK